MNPNTTLPNETTTNTMTSSKDHLATGSQAETKHKDCYCDECYPYVTREAHRTVFNGMIENHRKYEAATREIARLMAVIERLQSEKHTN